MTILFRFIILLALCFSHGVVIAQSDNIVANFYGSLSGNKVYLTWTIKAGNTCNGIGIERSTDTVNYSLIGNVEGICGNVSFPTQYSFTDEAPIVNTLNYYRLNLGGSGFSQFVSVEVFDFSDVGFLILPQPVSQTSRILFANDSGFTCLLNVYSLTGDLVYSESTNLDHFVIDETKLENGEYFFQITAEGSSESLSGKIMVIIQ